MEENKKYNSANGYSVEPEGDSLFTPQNLLAIFILNWKWFIFSVVVCLGVGVTYLRYKTPTYEATAKMLVKDEDNRRRSSAANMLQNIENLGLMSNSAGIDNEVEILASHSVAMDAVKHLKLYTTYKIEGNIKNRLTYKIQPVVVDLDATSLDDLKAPISVKVEMEDGKYVVSGKYTVVYKDERESEKKEFDRVFSLLPARIKTEVGVITISKNPDALLTFNSGKATYATIVNPAIAADVFVKKLTVAPTSKMTSIAQVTIVDEIPDRALDYLNQLFESYNDQANQDKNEIALRTEEFINQRLEKINAELGATEGKLESYKRENNVVEVTMNAQKALSQSAEYEKKLTEMSTQLALLHSINDYMNMPQNKYQTLPSNVGLEDQAATQLINTYNNIVLERNRLLRSASENSPTVQPLTAQLNDLTASIRRAMTQARKNIEIQKNAMQSQFSKYTGEIRQTPSQERMLTQIGRQQEVTSGLYLMLLQKREENSISLAATANKGKIIDEPSLEGMVQPKSNIVMMIAFVLGFVIPFAIFILLQLLRYKIEGHDDVAKLTTLPIVADIPVASEKAKTKADIVVHENVNNHMEEIFRSLRTNILFTMKQDEKVIMFTSSTSGEGKTFIAANLAVSLALLGKKVALLGLDIRKPRLAELFGINDHVHGITPLLVKDNPTVEDVRKQIVPSGVNKNLDLLMAGPIPPNPAELVARKSLGDVVNLLKEEYDYILMDTAPVGLVTDTITIGRLANSTVYVCRADYTPKTAFGYLNELAEENKLTNLSVVINGIDFSQKKYGYYYGYGSYGKYGKYGSYGKYGKYGKYGNYGSYGNYSTSHYSNEHDDSIKK